MKLLIVSFLWVCFLFSKCLYANQGIMACSVHYPPFVIEKGDSLTGIIPEVLTIVFDKKLGIPITFRRWGSWKRCQKAVESGRFDIMMAAVHNDEREIYAVYTKVPIAEDPQSVFVWKGREFTFQEWNDLKGKRAGVRLGISLGKKFDSFLSENFPLRAHLPSRAQVYKMLELNRIDFTPDGFYPGFITVKELGYSDKIVALKNNIDSEFLFAPMSKKSKHIDSFNKYDELLEVLKADGVIDKVIEHHEKALLE
ncbi:substrate-binding periplasmic protein [Spartinivicinus poritis]|uniref:Transporter substrate-binding domain-containing protein n=1 Tax=Spartinivicinus poritis TaxID=2994640 RepID=A0ABT5UBH9_9GAMM|nr:transporter substrate-binding domain-containing protein [Spartinivicinus sp. A2-2]MDE1463336.1 transporter substrate-binding domain-containing protein [Spartinivicinus sp. A2-2]